jgi:hypothetical protein
MQPVRWFPFAAVILVALPTSLVASAATPSPASSTTSSSFPSSSEIRFNRDIRPILSENCFQCHGPDAATRKAKLRLDVRTEALAAGAIVPGDPDLSSVIDRVLTDDENDLMPPPASLKSLTPEQKDLLRRWIAAGAEYEAHWAFTPLQRPSLPHPDDPADTTDPQPAASLHPIDAFIRATLTAKNLAPAPEAPRATLLRRLSLDLTGLPPTPEDVQTFLLDTAPGAYERQVERLLHSPHYGERMAVPWLDAVRFADTVGYHGDQNQRIFPYRDWVINAFNRNLPFDQFTVAQIAGDLLPHPSPDDLVASGFNRLNMMTREGGAQPKEYLAKYQSDRVRTVSTAWLGATLACAECHDHKYDPFTQRDFYSFAAFFADLRQWGVYADYHYTPEPELRGVNNDSPFPPEIEVPSPYLAARRDRLSTEADTLVTTTARSWQNDPLRRARFRAWRAEAEAFLAEYPSAWRVPPEIQVTSGDGTNAQPAAVSRQPDGSLRYTSDTPANDRFELSLQDGWLAALRLELLPDPERDHAILRGNRRETTLSLSAELRPASGGKPQPIRFVWADANLKGPRHANTHDILGVHQGWRTSAEHSRDAHTSVWWLESPRRILQDDTLVVSVRNHAATRLRLATSPFALQPRQADAEAAVLAQGPDHPAYRPLVQQLYLTGSTAEPEALAQWRRIQRNIAECRDGRAWTMVSQSTTNLLTTRLLPRGNWMDDSGPVVLPETPHFLPGPHLGLSNTDESDDPASPPSVGRVSLRGVTPPPTGRRLTRLDLAQWLVASDNPLTARNLMNRLWAQFFGTGISPRTEDLGLQGEWPTHPELLDWLAVEFRDSGWNVRHMVRLLVTSATYRQEAVPSLRARDLDPRNTWLSYQSPRRLDAEFVRDNALAIAGLLQPDIGGPSVFPYQPPDYYANLQFPDRRYDASPDDRQYRRGLYMHWQRTFLHPMLANFDAPSREECVAGRLQSNTPQQALTLLNDPSFVEAARVLATHLLDQPGTDPDRLTLLYQRALARSPRIVERNGLQALLDRQRQHYSDQPQEALALAQLGQTPPPNTTDPATLAELAAWTQVCRVVLNLHETLTRY